MKTDARKQIEREQRDNLKREFLTQWRRLGGPDLEEEYKFHPVRGWAFDFAYIQPGLNIAIELEGGVWLKEKSGHTTGKGYSKDCQKYNQAQLLGFWVFRFTADMLATDPAGHLEPVIKLMRGEL